MYSESTSNAIIVKRKECREMGGRGIEHLLLCSHVPQVLVVHMKLIRRECLGLQRQPPAMLKSSCSNSFCSNLMDAGAVLVVHSMV